MTTTISAHEPMTQLTDYPFLRHFQKHVARYVLALAILIAAGGCANRNTFPSRSFADLQYKLKSGNTVYVVDAKGGETKGKVVEVTATALTLDAGGKPWSMDRTNIRQVDRQTHSLWRGFFIGAAIGSMGVLCAAQGVCYGYEAIVDPLLFGAIGVGIDAAIRHPQTLYFAPDNLVNPPVPELPPPTPTGAPQPQGR